MKRKKSFISLTQKQKDEEGRNYNFSDGITKNLLGKYNPSKVIKFSSNESINPKEKGVA